MKGWNFFKHVFIPNVYINIVGYAFLLCLGIFIFIYLKEISIGY